MKITLKAGEKLFLNGAVIRSDKKVTLELINDAVFLLENHVLQKEDTNTPLKQIYFVAQMMLIDPDSAGDSKIALIGMIDSALKTFSNMDILFALKDCLDLAEKGKNFDILKILRRLFPIENEIIAKNKNIQV